MTHLPAELVRHLFSDADVSVPATGEEEKGLPTPAPLDLAEIPIIRAVNKQERPGPDGKLPREAHYVEYEVTNLAGVKTRVEISGSPEYGLPYGHDGDILLALFKLIDERGFHDGVFREPSFRMIASALRVEANGGSIARIQDSLRRLGQVTILTTAVQDAEQLALRIRADDDGAHPLAPTMRVPRTKREQSRWMIEYDVRIEERGGAGEGGEVNEEVWIDHLVVSPFWISQAISGWVAWIDLDVYSRLRSPVAKRLYALMASRIARGASPPWYWRTSELSSVLGLRKDTRASRIREAVVRASNSLVEEAVLDEFHYSGERGQYTFRFTPGSALETASLLRGVGLMDLRRLRVQVALLQAFGMAEVKAREMVLDDPEQVRRVLERAIYIMETGSERVRNYPGWIWKTYRQRWRFDGDMPFVRWKKARMSGGAPAAVPRIEAAKTPGEKQEAVEESDASVLEFPGAGADAPEVSALSEEAVELWADLKDAFLARDDAQGLAAAAVKHLAPYSLSDTTLTCVTRYDFFADWLRQWGHLEAMEKMLPELGPEGVVEFVVISEEDLLDD